MILLLGEYFLSGETENYNKRSMVKMMYVSLFLTDFKKRRRFSIRLLFFCKKFFSLEFDVNVLKFLT